MGDTDTTSMTINGLHNETEQFVFGTQALQSEAFRFRLAETQNPAASLSSGITIQQDQETSMMGRAQEHNSLFDVDGRERSNMVNAAMGQPDAFVSMARTSQVGVGEAADRPAEMIQEKDEMDNYQAAIDFLDQVLSKQFAWFDIHTWNGLASTECCSVTGVTESQKVVIREVYHSSAHLIAKLPFEDGSIVAMPELPIISSLACKAGLFSYIGNIIGMTKERLTAFTSQRKEYFGRQYEELRKVSFAVISLLRSLRRLVKKFNCQDIINDTWAKAVEQKLFDCFDKTIATSIQRSKRSNANELEDNGEVVKRTRISRRSDLGEVAVTNSPTSNSQTKDGWVVPPVAEFTGIVWHEFKQLLGWAPAED